MRCVPARLCQCRRCVEHSLPCRRPACSAARSALAGALITHISKCPRGRISDGLPLPTGQPCGPLACKSILSWSIACTALRASAFWAGCAPEAMVAANLPHSQPWGRPRRQVHDGVRPARGSTAAGRAAGRERRQRAAPRPARHGRRAAGRLAAGPLGGVGAVARAAAGRAAQAVAARGRPRAARARPAAHGARACARAHRRSARPDNP